MSALMGILRMLTCSLIYLHALSVNICFIWTYVPCL